MQIREDYTPETICRLLGLPGFEHDPALQSVQGSMRLLLRPSFHPEVCITLTSCEPEATLEARSPRESIWQTQGFAFLPVWTETAQLLRVDFDEICRLMLAVPEAERSRGLWIDGMPFSIVMYSGSQSVRLRGQTSDEPYITLINKVFRVCHASIQNPRLRNNVAEAARYVGVSLERALIDAESDKPLISLLILGAEEEKADYFAQLKQATAKGGTSHE
jgi:hypothetical protein